MNSTRYSGVENHVGKTPLIRLRKLSELTRCEILGKAEFMNPGGSVKDRAALGMILVLACAALQQFELAVGLLVILMLLGVVSAESLKPSNSRPLYLAVLACAAFWVAFGMGTHDCCLDVPGCADDLGYLGVGMEPVEPVLTAGQGGEEGQVIEGLGEAQPVGIAAHRRQVGQDLIHAQRFLFDNRRHPTAQSKTIVARKVLPGDHDDRKDPRPRRKRSSPPRATSAIRWTSAWHAGCCAAGT